MRLLWRCSVCDYHVVMINEEQPLAFLVVMTIYLPLEHFETPSKQIVNDLLVMEMEG